ncbi:MAG: RNA polymerase sigma factor [Pseudomonadales bacterium]
MSSAHQSITAIKKDTSDEVLVSLAIKGSEVAFEYLMRRYNQRLFRIARSILKNDADAEDAVQNSYIHAWRSLDSFQFHAQLSTWLARIVVNESLGRIRKSAKAQIISLDAKQDSQLDTKALDDSYQLAIDTERQPEHLAMRTELRKIIEAYIDTLPDSFRTVFVMRALEEMSVEEVAHALDIPESTVKTRFFRARSLLREKIATKIDLTMEDAFSFAGDRCDRIVTHTLSRARNEGFIKQTDG